MGEGHRKETYMPNTDQMKGRAKEAAGALTGDSDLKNEGRADQSAGKAQEVIDTAKDKVNEAGDKLKGAIHRD